MLAEFLIAFAVIALSLSGLGLGLLFGRGAPQGSCAAALNSIDGECPLCGLDNLEQGERK